jgi:hypothetical protein
MKSYEIKLMSEGDERAYETLVKSRSDTLFYHSIHFRNLLRKFVGEDYYLLAMAGEEAVAAIPAFLKSSQYGNVLNSLPFWGSNGGIIVKTSLPADEERSVKRTLLQSFYELADQLECVLSTIIVSPLEKDQGFYEQYAKADFRDERIGQITILPDSPDANELLRLFESVRRRNIKKALKSGISCYQSNDPKAMKFLFELHVENISHIGGLTKPAEFFEAVQNVLAPGVDYRLYLAEKDRSPVAGLLLFYFNGTVEYYIPGVVSAYRTLQPLSLVIFEAMLDAIREGYKYWNWGGTWHSQKGVYDFKKRWGTEDFPYRYYIASHRNSSQIKSLSPSEIQAAYPYFYVLPFSQLEA